MARSQEMTLALVIVAIVIGVILASLTSMAFMSGTMMGGGMMGGEVGGLNLAWLVPTIVLVIILIIILAMLLSPPREQPLSTPSPAVYPNGLGTPVSQPFAPVVTGDFPHATRTQEATIVRMLDEDERRLYALIRERGGEMLQKDIVASGSFSKAKVTRLLDKLERKEIVVRERHGMTNKVRLVTMPPMTSDPS